jgi:hypothetical protein
MHPTRRPDRPRIQLVDGAGAESRGPWAWSSRRLVGHFGVDGTFLYISQMVINADTEENRVAWKFVIDFLFHLVNNGGLAQSQLHQRIAPRNAASVSSTNLRLLMTKLSDRTEQWNFQDRCMRMVRGALRTDVLRTTDRSMMT